MLQNESFVASKDVWGNTSTIADVHERGVTAGFTGVRIS